MTTTTVRRIPTNLIVGFLGSGKTTAINKLIANRPVGEKWSILINEFGKVSIDHALVDSGIDGINVQELGGGCACCTLALVFKPLLAQFIRRTKPDRLILEPSGLSHPAKVIDILRSQGFASSIDLRNVICLVDPKDLDDPKWKESQVFRDQIQLADIVAINWTDQRDPAQTQRCREWIETFDPPKQLVFETQFGVIDRELLDRDFGVARMPLFEDAHPLPMNETLSATDADQESQPIPLGSQLPAAGKPLRFQNSGLDFNACGWVFHVDDVFNRRKLVKFFEEIPSVLRLKGIFHCDADWWSINQAKDATTYVEATWRGDSRLELIVANDDFDWFEFERRLYGCLAE